jgi:hypothetical protein
LLLSLYLMRSVVLLKLLALDVSIDSLWAVCNASTGFFLRIGMQYV